MNKKNQTSKTTDKKSAHRGRQLRGSVVSTKMDKTVVVSVAHTYRHPLYRKTVRRSRKFFAHNDAFELSQGDEVIIGETRPISKKKHFIVLKKVD